MKKYVVYGNEEITALELAKRNGLVLDECIFCLDGCQQAKDCVRINSKLQIVGPEDE